MMVGQITDSFVGHIQIHKKGYLASIDNLPLTMNLNPKALKKVEKAIQETAGIEAWSSGSNSAACSAISLKPPI